MTDTNTEHSTTPQQTEAVRVVKTLKPRLIDFNTKNDSGFNFHMFFFSLALIWLGYAVFSWVLNIGRSDVLLLVACALTSLLFMAIFFLPDAEKARKNAELDDVTLRDIKTVSPELFSVVQAKILKGEKYTYEDLHIALTRYEKLARIDGYSFDATDLACRGPANWDRNAVSDYVVTASRFLLTGIAFYFMILVLMGDVTDILTWSKLSFFSDVSALPLRVLSAALYFWVAHVLSSVIQYFADAFKARRHA